MLGGKPEPNALRTEVRLRGERNGSRSGESLRQPVEHGEVGVKLDASQATDAKRAEAVLVLQPSELALDRRPGAVQLPPPFRLAGNERTQTGSLDPDGAKRRLADKLGSVATRGEGTQNLLCAYLAAAVLVGLLGNALLDLWWLDPAAALVVAAVAVREGRESWRGEGCCASC